MAYDTLVKEAKDLPEDMIEQVVKFISIAEDFDETPESFKEYL